MQAAIGRKVCLDPGKRGAFAVWPASATGFDSPSAREEAIFRCRSRSKTRSWPRNGRESGECRVNAIFYVLSTGCQWQALPKDLPPKSTAHSYFMLWDWDGTLERIHHTLYPGSPKTICHRVQMQ
jgi:hypothetical protein